MPAPRRSKARGRRRSVMPLSSAARISMASTSLPVPWPRAEGETQKSAMVMMWPRCWRRQTIAGPKQIELRYGPSHPTERSRRT
jgi:hypothetical protein